MILDGENLKAAHYCAALAIQSHRGRTVPPRIERLFRQLSAEVELSACGHQSWSDAGESETLSSVEVAEMVHRTERWVRRHPELLGGRKHGDRWRYSRAAVEQYLRKGEIS